MENKVEEEVKTEVSENKIEPINQSAEDKKKAKKKKNKKKKETSQQEEKKNSEGSSNQTQEIEEDPQKQYEKELQWCINQIKTGMSSNKLDQLQCNIELYALINFYNIK